MTTLPHHHDTVAKRNDEQINGDYRTKRVIFEIYDALAEALQTSKWYQTRLDPPPANPEVAHDRLANDNCLRIA